MGMRGAVAGIGLVLLTTVGCGNGVTGGEALPEQKAQGESKQQAGTIELPDLSGQQVCDLLSEETLAKHLPKAQTSNSTTASTEIQHSAMCDAKSLDGGAKSRFLTIEVTAALKAYVDGTVVEDATAEQAITEWVASQRAAEQRPEDLADVGDEAFTAVRQDTDGRTEGHGVFRSGIWGVKIVYHGLDRPNPDDRDNKVYLPKEVLVSGIAEMSAEIDGNLPGLADGSGGQTNPGELSGDALCSFLSDAVLERHLPEPKTNAHTGTRTEDGSGATCEWRSAQPRPDSPGLRILTGRVSVQVVTSEPEKTFEDAKQEAREEHDEGPEDAGADKGATSEAPKDVPDLGTSAFLVLSRSSPDSQYPVTVAEVVILLPENRIVEVSYGGGDAAELDTGSPGQGDLGTAKPLTDDESTEGLMAMVRDVLAKLG
jgi:hypothetical protein